MTGGMLIAASDSATALSGSVVDLVPACALALVAGAAIAYMCAPSWTHKSMLANGALIIVTTLGVSVLSGWNAPYVGPVHGICWIVGLWGTTVLVRRGIIRDHAAGLDHLPRRVKTEMEAFVRAHIAHHTKADFDRLINKKREQIVKQCEVRESACAAAMHDFIHCARDESVSYLATRERLIRELAATSNIPIFQQHLREAFEGQLRSVLQKALKVFEAVARQNDLWVSLRMLDESAGVRLYGTIVRIGKVNTDRAQHSVAIPENTGLPAFLRTEYDAGRGIVILGKKRKAWQWMKTVNDQRDEDVSVMAGPIIIKSQRGESERREMIMILYVNSPREGSFSDGHRDAMKCCTDTLSMLLSLESYVDAGTRIARNSPLTIGRI